MGVCHRDVELAALWLHWVSFLSRQPGGDRPRILVVFTQRSDPAPMFSAIGGASRIGLVRCPDEQERGYPGSASHLFLRTLEQAEQRFPGHAVLWCEPDTVPMRPTWASEIEAEYQTCGKPFLGAKVGEKFPHLAGNSVYPHNWRELAPSIENVLNAPDYKLWGAGKGQPWDVYCRGETTPQMAESKLWHHVWKERDARATRLKDIPAAACLFHQDKTGALIREIAAARYPEFMETLNEGRRFYLLNGHSSRLRAKGVKVKFSFERYQVGGWRSAVCSTEVTDDNASALATLAGHFGLREIDEAEFCKVTGRKAADLPAPKLRAIERAPAPEATHASVFVMLGRYGDICNCLPFLKAEADAGRRPTLVVAQEFADILDGVSYVDRIVWEGAYDRLPDALRWLHRDKGIRAPVVCQYHRNPYDKARLCDSYQKEVWRLAGRVDEFEHRGPLVFDRRNEERECALSAKYSTDKPLILVGLESVSSPLENANAILRAVVEGFGKTHDVVNLSNVKASRIYDLIGLFDRAACLVTADTAFLHLARASSVGVVALLNDGWRGSVSHEYVYPIRYSEAKPERVLEATKSASGLDVGALIDMCHDLKRSVDAQKAFPEKLEPGEDIRVREVSLNQVDITISSRLAREIAKPKIFHVVDVFGSAPRHHVAQSTWAAAYAEGMVPVHVSGYAREAKAELGDARALPFLKDLLSVAINEADDDNDVVVWSNSDVGLAKGTAAAIGAHVREHGAASMRRVESNGEHHIGRDLFAFTVKWLRDHWEEFPDYVIGAPVFDLGLVAMIRKSHGLPTTMKNMKADMAPADMPAGYALHESHKSEWDVNNVDSVPSVRWNKEQFRNWAKKYAPEIRFSKGGNFQ
jgi:hypothetical protein